MRNSRKEYLILFAVLILSFFARIYLLEDQQLATDEDFTILFGHNILRGDFERVLVDPSPPAYYFFIAFLQSIFDSVYFLRLVTALLSILTLFIFYKLAKKIFTTKQALFSTFLLSLNPLFFIYSRHLRNYLLLTLVFVIASYFFYLFLFEKKDKALYGLAVCYALLFYINFFSVFLILSHGVILLYALYKKEFTFKTKYLKAAALSLFLVLLWIPFFLSQFKRAVVEPGNIKLYPLRLIEVPYPLYKLSIMADVSTVSHSFPYLFILFGLLTILILYGVYQFFKQDKYLGLFTTLSLFGPPLILLLLNPIIEAVTTDHYSLYYFRYFVYLVPIYILLLSNALFSFKSKPLKIILTSLIIIGWIIVILYYYSIVGALDWSTHIAV